MAIASKPTQSNVVLGTVAGRKEKIKLILLSAYLLGWIIVPVVATGKAGGLIAGLIGGAVAIWFATKMVKIPPSNEFDVPADLIRKIDEIRKRLTLERVIVNRLHIEKHPQVMVMSQCVSLSEHVLKNWPQSAILWQIEVELSSQRKAISRIFAFTLIEPPLVGMSLWKMDSPQAGWFLAIAIMVMVILMAYLYRIETHDLLVADQQVTTTKEARAAAQIALSDPYFYVEAMKWYDRPLSISRKWIKRRAERLGILLVRPQFPDTRENH